MTTKAAGPGCVCALFSAGAVDGSQWFSRDSHWSLTILIVTNGSQGTGFFFPLRRGASPKDHPSPRAREWPVHVLNGPKLKLSKNAFIGVLNA